MTLGQQEPVVPRMLYQPSADLHQALLQAGQRPLAERFGQRQPSPQVAKVVGEHAQPQPHPWKSTLRAIERELKGLVLRLTHR